MVSLLQTPLEIARTVSDSVRALAELPVAFERSLRGTTALIEETRAQIALLGEQVQGMMDQLEKMATVTDRLLDGTQAITNAANDAAWQMAQTSEQLAATNRSLEQIVRLAGPLDRAGKRLAEGLARVTGRGKPPGETAE